MMGVIVAMIVVVAGFIAFVAVSRDVATREHQHVAPAKAADAGLPLARRETGPTLDPAGFSGKAAVAYQVAREIPDVLDQLQCYCACGSQYGHVSLLSCYADGHGAT